MKRAKRERRSASDEAAIKALGACLCPQCGSKLVRVNAQWVQCEKRVATLANPRAIGSACDFHCGVWLVEQHGGKVPA